MMKRSELLAFFFVLWRGSVLLSAYEALSQNLVLSKPCLFIPLDAHVCCPLL